MPVSGLILTFDQPVTRHVDALDQLRGASEIEVGDANGIKLAIVVDTATQRRDQEVWRWLNELPGVSRVDVAFVGFDEEDPPPPDTPRAGNLDTK